MLERLVSDSASVWSNGKVGRETRKRENSRMYCEKGGGFVVWLARKIGAEKKAKEEAVSA